MNDYATFLREKINMASFKGERQVSMPSLFDMEEAEELAA